MGKRKGVLLCIALAGLACLAACGGPPAATPTAAATAAPTPVLVDRVEQLLGTWHGLEADGKYQRFLADGRLVVAQTLQGLDSDPAAELSYRLEGTQLIIAEVKAISLPPCGSVEGIYEVQLESQDRIKLKRIRDTCQGRARTTGQVHERVK